MKMLKRVICKLIPLIICTVTPGLVFAQVSDSGSEVFFNVGHGKLLDDETNLGSGLVFGFGYGYRFNQRWSLVLEGSRNDHLRDRSGESFKFEGHAYLAGGGLQYHFRDRFSILRLDDNRASQPDKRSTILRQFFSHSIRMSRDYRDRAAQ